MSSMMYAQGDGSGSSSSGGGMDFGAGAAVGGVAGSLLNYSMQQQTNSTNTRNAWEQRSWENTMSSTAHQREVKDLIAAGLNPVLSAGGNGASTPSGAMPSIQAPQIDTTPVFQALAFTNKQQELDQDQQKIELAKNAQAAEIAKKTSETDLNKIKQITQKKGLVRGEVEEKASGIVRKLMDWAEKSFQTPSSAEALKRHNQLTGQYLQMGDVMGTSQPTVTPQP